MKRMEILAPAGNIDILRGVVNAGADAVYFGGKQFSARAYANNLDLDESISGIDYAHLHGCKAYLTLNTLIKNVEFEGELHDYINFYYTSGIDGIIVSDLGVIKYIRDNFPDLPIHGSTQMAICSVEGANLLSHIGVRRIVPARELSLEEIEDIHKSCDIELEVFVHGAMCYSYSGDCLLSSIIGGRSGNRGRCAGPCRLEYKLYDGDTRIDTPGNYLLSLKDLCGVERLYDLYTSGVTSLKIEGRMKQSDYACGVTNVYRRYVDKLMDNIASGRYELDVSKDDKKLLHDLGNRCGFTDSYYSNNTDSMVTYTSPAHTNYDIKANFSEDKIEVACKFTARVNKPIEIKLRCRDIIVSKKGFIADVAKTKAITTSDIASKLTRTGQTSYVLSDIDIDIDDNIFIPLGEINRIRQKALSELNDAILSTHKKESVPRPSYNRGKPPSSDRAYDISPLLISVSTKEQLEAVISFANDIAYDIVIPMTSYDLFKSTMYAGLHRIVQLPFIIRKDTLRLLYDNIDTLSAYDGVIAPSLDALHFAKNNLNSTIIAGSHIYTYNNQAECFAEELGCDYTIAPLELNYGELSHRYNYRSIFTIYGRVPVMITKNCLNKNCISCDGVERTLRLVDRRRHSFPVRNYCKMCYNVIYNDVVTSLIDDDRTNNLGFAAKIIEFIDEDYSMTRRVIEQYSSHTISDYPHTRGHFNRGVE